MSEQLSSEEVPPESTDVEGPKPIDTESAKPPARRLAWIAPAWFLLGIIVGIVGFGAYNAFMARPATTSDSVAMRNAARDGVIEAIATLSAPGARPSGQQSDGPQPVDKGAIVTRAANVRGNPNAKVTIVEFADYQCPFCKRFQQTISPALLKQYVDSGQANFAYMHMAILGQESIWAAQASECAADQGKFWDYHDLLFEKQTGENVGTFTKDKLIDLAKGLNLDMAKFAPCLQNDETLPRVTADTQEGEKLGVRGTPTFFINGQPLVGAQPIEAFQQLFAKVAAQ